MFQCVSQYGLKQADMIFWWPKRWLKIPCLTFSSHKFKVWDKSILPTLYDSNISYFLEFSICYLPSIELASGGIVWYCRLYLILVYLVIPGKFYLCIGVFSPHFWYKSLYYPSSGTFNSGLKFRNQCVMNNIHNTWPVISYSST